MHPCDNAEELLRTMTAARRNHYFYGKRMDVQHFRMEQDYGKLKQWLVNRLAVGKGVFCGMRVAIDGDRLCVDPGVALDGIGREIVVPARACLDPFTQEGGCCRDPCCPEPATPPAPPVDPRNPDQPHGDPPSDPTDRRKMRGVYTLWACYRECHTDFQPVLVNECEARERCAPGTIVESYCFKVTPGLPLQTDPAWCAKLWRQGEYVPPAGAIDPDEWSKSPPNMLGPCGGTMPELPGSDEIRAALESYRHQICELFDYTCDPGDADPCVPLAAFLMRDGRIAEVDSCLVRPRLYSNAMLFDMMLCLMQRIDECCGDHPPPPPPTAELLRVRRVDFLGPDGQIVATVDNPHAVTAIPPEKMMLSIAVHFTGAFEQGAHVPTTAGLGETNFKRHNTLVVPEPRPRYGMGYVPLELTIEGPDRIRLEIHRESRYFNPELGWQKGLYRLRIFGDDDTAIPRAAIVDLSGTHLDAEPIVPAGGVMSGDGTPGGEFTLVFRIG